ncbi:MAG TPA: hypoxanthine phosphoribosyltransferase [Ignavibacteriales bacterium]|nr:hypoxanthine phosphoribosyltransferase [Ignavibacteriales bacterium]
MLSTDIKDIVIGDDVFEVYISAEQLQAKIKEVAEVINKDYKDTVPVFICTLNGAFMFMSDLMKNINIECEVDFLKLSSYGDAKLSSGNVKLLKNIDCKIEGRDIIVVEDIVDTGLSLQYMKNLLLELKPKSLKFVSLLVKREAIKYDVQIDYYCFDIPNKFVIGYGLDLAQKYRNLPHIYKLKN